MPDAKEWEKVAENIVKTRNWLYEMTHDDCQYNKSVNKIENIRFLLMIALEEIDKLAAEDAKGWL